MIRWRMMLRSKGTGPEGLTRSGRIEWNLLFPCFTSIRVAIKLSHEVAE